MELKNSEIGEIDSTNLPQELVQRTKVSNLEDD